MPNVSSDTTLFIYSSLFILTILPSYIFFYKMFWILIINIIITFINNTDSAWQSGDGCVTVRIVDSLYIIRIPTSATVKFSGLGNFVASIYAGAVFSQLGNNNTNGARQQLLADGRVTSDHCRVTILWLFSKFFQLAWNVEKTLFDSRATVAWPPNTVAWPFSDFFQKIS